MIFSETSLKGAFIINLEKREDDRGFFARTWCEREFKEHGLNTGLVQANLSYNKKKGTVRGLHYQRSPHEEVKLVRCTGGKIYDVIVDLRPDSDTYKDWLGVELAADKYTMLYVPGGFAHAFQTLADNSEVIYQVSAFYHPASEAGLRWNDPAFDIRWPIEVEVISDKDRSWPDFVDNRN